MTREDAEIAQIFATDVTFTDERDEQVIGVITHLMVHALGGGQVAEVVTRSGRVRYIDIEELTTD